MAKLSKSDFLKALQDYIGDRNDDASLALIEDATDSYIDADVDTVPKADYDALDASWREKYKARFFDGPAADGSNGDGKPDDNGADDDTPAEDVQIDDLFEDKKKEGE